MISIQELLRRAAQAERLAFMNHAGTVRDTLLAYADELRAQAEQLAQDEGETIPATESLAS